MSAFQRKRTAPKIRGSRPSLQNGQLLVSSGNSSLDAIFSGGLPVGSVLLIEEDRYVSYSKALHRYFLAEGAVHHHRLLLVNLDDDPAEFLKKIPQPCPESAVSRKASSVPPEPVPEPGKGCSDDLRIAWRYNAMPMVDAEQKLNNTNYSFDLTTELPAETLATLDTTTLDRTTLNVPCECTGNMFRNPAYSRLLEAIKLKATPVAADEAVEPNLLRISIASMGSPVWYDTDFSQDVCRFLTGLRALVRNTLSVCCLSMPVHLFKEHDDRLLPRIRNLVDYSIELESFSGSDRETNPIFKEFHGLLYIRRLTALNTLSSCVPETHDLAFKLRRKQFVVEKLHLPPELQEAGDEASSGGHESAPTLSCASTGRSKLDF